MSPANDGTRDESLPLAGRARELDAEGVAADGGLAERLPEAQNRLESETLEFDISSTVDRSIGAHPDLIGRFQIERQLGHGGLGVVFLGRDPELHRYVAIKIPRGGMVAGSELERRFLREGEAVARLSHPHLVSLYEVGRDGPFCYLVSEYCPGPTLAEWLKACGRPLPPRQAATLVQQLASAVQHAHTRGVLHRDVKPGNVLLTKLEHAEVQAERAAANVTRLCDGLGVDGLWPKLTDFGMAKLLESSLDETRPGTVIGTPAYMAPEQADARMHVVDARTDVYGLGAVLYELLTGVAPHRGTWDADTLRHLLMQEPVGPRRLCLAVPRDLEAVCLKCLARHADARYPTAQQLAEDLGQFLLGQPTKARPLGPTGWLWKWARRRPTTAALAGLSVAAAVALIALVVTYNVRLREEISRADHALDRAKQTADASRKLLYTADVRVAYETLKANNVVKALEALQRQIPDSEEEDLREFAWYYLRDQCEPESITLARHQGDVFSVAYSPDGSLLATAGKDGTARLWDAETGRQLRVLRGHKTEVTSVAFAPHGDTLATASEDRTVRLWQPRSAAADRMLVGHTDHVMTVAFSPDARFLASGSRDTTVRIWNPASGATIATLDRDHMDVIRSVVFAPSGNTLFAVDEGGDIHAWRTIDWKRVGRAHFARDKLFALAVSRDATRLAAAGRRESIWICDPLEKDLKSVHEFAGGHNEWIQGLVFSPTDHVLASAGKDGTIRLWKPAATNPYRTLLGHRDRVWSLAWSPDGRELASASADATVKIWSLADEAARRYPPAPYSLTNPVFSGDGGLLVLGDYGAGLSIWSPTSRSMSKRVPTLHGGTFGLDLSPDNVLVATVRSMSGGGVVKIWHLETMEEVLSLPVAETADNALTWAPRGHRLAYAIDDKTVVLRNLESGRNERQFEHSTAVRYLAFTSDGRHLATTSQSLDIWDVHTGRVEYSLPEAHSKIAVARDRSLIAAASGSNVTLIDLTSDRPGVSTLVTIGSDVDGLSIDGNTLAVALRRAQAVCLWDIRTRQQLMRLDCDLDQIHGLAFSPDGRRLVATGRAAGKGGIREWTIGKRP